MLLRAKGPGHYAAFTRNQDRRQTGDTCWTAQVKQTSGQTNKQWQDSEQYI